MLTFSLDTLPDAAYVGRIRYEAGWQNPQGRPRMPSLYYVYSGRMRFSVEGREVSLCAGSALLLTNGYPYTVCVEEDCDYSYFQFNVAEIEREGLHFEKRAERKLPSHESALSLPLASAMTAPREQAEHLAGMVLRHAACSAPFDKIRLDIALMRLLLLFGEGVATAESGKEERYGKNSYLAMREYIEAHYADPLSLSLVSREMGISAQYAARVFRRHAACSVTAFIQRVRLEKSEELLRYTPLSISQIAFAVGFSSPYYYCRLFSRAYGTTPSDFRRATMEEI